MKIVLEQLCCPSYITTIELARTNCKKTSKLDLLVAQSVIFILCIRDLIGSQQTSKQSRGDFALCPPFLALGGCDRNSIPVQLEVVN